MTDITLRIPRDLASIVRTALEARAKEFEAPLPSTYDVLPSREITQVWKAYAIKLRALAAKLPRT